MDSPTVGAFVDKIAENNHLAGSDENQLGEAQIALRMAQRVSLELRFHVAKKIEASIK